MIFELIAEVTFDELDGLFVILGRFGLGFILLGDLVLGIPTVHVFLLQNIWFKMIVINPRRWILKPSLLQRVPYLLSCLFNRWCKNRLCKHYLLRPKVLTLFSLNLAQLLKFINEMLWLLLLSLSIILRELNWLHVLNGLFEVIA